MAVNDQNRNQEFSYTHADFWDAHKHSTCIQAFGYLTSIFLKTDVMYSDSLAKCLPVINHLTKVKWFSVFKVI